jgi:hypothetical protein
MGREMWSVEALKRKKRRALPLFNASTASRVHIE